MTRVDFYIVRNGGIDAALLFACKLAEKAWARQHRIRVIARDTGECAQFSELLWRFRPDSFLPQISDGDNTVDGAIQIGETAGADHSDFDVLINLGRDIESGFSRYQRVAEIVCQDTGWLHASRDRYKYYRDRGHPLNRHEVSA